MNTLTFQAGDIIFRQGDFPASMYYIVKGKVGVYKDYETEKMTELAQLGEGQFLGEMGMLEVYPRSATAVALEDGTVLNEIDEDGLNDFFKDRPEDLLQILKQLSGRIRVTNDRYLDACHVAFECIETEKNGAEKSAELQARINEICKDYEEL